MQKGTFVSIENSKQPWAPWRIWVEDAWVRDDMGQSFHSVAMDIFRSGWVGKT